MSAEVLRRVAALMRERHANIGGSTHWYAVECLPGGVMTDGHTIDVGHVHVLEHVDGPCRPDCPHPDHSELKRPSSAFDRPPGNVFEVPAGAFHPDDGLCDDPTCPDRRVSHERHDG